MPIDLYTTLDSNSDWAHYMSVMRPNEDNIVILTNEISDPYMILYNTQTELSFSIINLKGAEPTITIEPNNSSLCEISGITSHNINNTLTKITFTLKALSIEGSTDITISVKVNDVTYTKTFTVNVVEVLPSSYEVHSISGVQYGFELNADGLYESQNKGKESTFALCKVTIYNPAGLNVFVDCINYAEQGFDYGILGNVDTVLESNKTADNTSKVKQTFKNSSSADIQTVEYGALETDSYIYIKYIKDGSSDRFNDSLQFKVRFE